TTLFRSQRSALVRKEHHGERSVYLRRICGWLTLGRQEESQLFYKRPALSRWLPSRRDSRHGATRRRGTKRAGADRIPWLQSCGARRHREDRREPSRGPGESLGL